MSDVEGGIGYEVKHGEVQYFYIDEGLPADDGKRAMDMQYMKYLVQDNPLLKMGKGHTVFWLNIFLFAALQRCVFLKIGRNTGLFL